MSSFPISSTVIIKSSTSVQQPQSSSEEPSMSEWSSLENIILENTKSRLHAEGLYSPGSGEICPNYIQISNSEITKHAYYNYPAVTDPGINEAIRSPEKPLIYPDDGQELYLALCSEMNMCPVRMFHKNLLNEEINLSYYGVSPKSVCTMATALQYNRYVRRFNLTDNFLNDDACYHLNQMIQSNVTIKELILTGCRIGASGTRCLVARLYLNRSLKMLNLARNNIGDGGGLHIANQIELGCNIKRINLSNNQLGRETATALAEALLFKDYITNFDLSKNHFFHVPSTVKMLHELAEGLRLRELNLSWNSLEGERIGYVIQEILLIPNLRVLDLSHNKLKDEAITAIASNLIKATKLEMLDLSFNPMSPIDAYNLLMNMLRPRFKLATLLLEDVRVSKSFLELLDRVRRMKSRKNFVITHGSVVENWTIKGADPRELILRRAFYLGNAEKKHLRKDVPLFFLKLCKEYPTLITLKAFTERVENDGMPLDADLLSEFACVFPGPINKRAKFQTVNLKSICEYVHRLWPEKQLPPTYPPEPLNGEESLLP